VQEAHYGTVALYQFTWRIDLCGNSEHLHDGKNARLIHTLKMEKPDVNTFSKYYFREPASQLGNVPINTPADTLTSLKASNQIVQGKTS